MIKRIEIDKDYASELLEVVSDNNVFEWYWNDATTIEYKRTGVLDSKTLDTPQFTHILFSNGKVHSNFYHFFSEMFSIIEKEFGCKIKNVIRVKANLMTKDACYPDGFYNGAHTDSHNDNIFTFLYYVNDSDGDTIFFSDFLDGNKDHNITELVEVHRETPKCGTGLIFKSNQLHTPTPPKYSNRRIVVNYVFEIENETNNTKL